MGQRAGFDDDAVRRLANFAEDEVDVAIRFGKGPWPPLNCEKFLDDDLGEQIRELRDRVTKLFEELQPDAVITWGPSGWTGHPDHRLVSSIEDLLRRQVVGRAEDLVVAGADEWNVSALDPDHQRQAHRLDGHDVADPPARGRSRARYCGSGNDVGRQFEGQAKTAAFVAQWGEFVKSLLLLHQAFTQAGAECTNRAAGLEQVMGNAAAAV